METHKSEQSPQDILTRLCLDSGIPDPIVIDAMQQSGSNRKYYRITTGGGTLIGVVGTSAAENKAFINLAQHFADRGIAVPEVIAVDKDYMSYIQTDLGSLSLYDYMASARSSGTYTLEQEEALCKTMSELAVIQCKGAYDLDFSVCWPEPAFSRRMVQFDLNYFKYCFLKPRGVEFDEILLQNDMDALTDDILTISLSSGISTFMYRDFQARNVMLKDGCPHFIDFQGGRKGPIYYDIASFVWQAKSQYPAMLKKKMISSYLESLSGFVAVEEEDFMNNLRLFVLFRTMQVLGAYGFRGLVERKSHFMESIPFALKNIKALLSDSESIFGGPAKEWESRYPYLVELLSGIAANSEQDHVEQGTGLHVDIYSFSFKKGIPSDSSGNGGGYVFDCRSINNPGRYEQYKKLTGMDAPVISFLEQDGEIFSFLDHVSGVVEPHVETFLKRGFTHLQVSFGCTGGQHRSVYCAEALAKRLIGKYPLTVHLEHREQGVRKTMKGI